MVLIRKLLIKKPFCIFLFMFMIDTTLGSSTLKKSGAMETNNWEALVWNIKLT